MLQPFEQPEIIAYSNLMIDSFQRLTGRALLAPGPDAARRLYEAPFALASHGVEDDPILRYGNRAALTLWKMSWETFTSMPSRLTAESSLREERGHLLDEARARGCFEGYQGVRVASDGQRFRIRNTVLWNVDDASGTRQGQACVIYDWDLL